jgi:hypothetical protein
MKYVENTAKASNQIPSTQTSMINPTWLDSNVIPEFVGDGEVWTALAAMEGTAEKIIQEMIMIAIVTVSERTLELGSIVASLFWITVAPMIMSLRKITIRIIEAMRNDRNTWLMETILSACKESPMHNTNGKV